MKALDWVEVFDPKEEIWIPQPEEHHWDLPYASGEFTSYIVMKEKIHMSGSDKFLTVFYPFESYQMQNPGSRL